MLIMGRHPLLESVAQQYAAQGWEVALWQTGEALPTTEELYGCGEFFVTADDPTGLQPEAADYAAMALLAKLAGRMANRPGDGRPTCHLLLRSQRVLRMVQSCDFCEAVRQRLDVYPFTVAEVWSRTIRLDDQPITAQSAQRAHLVVFGMNEVAEAVVIQAALTAHYPNYVTNHKLRTRITMIADDAIRRHEELTNRYPHLFDNSFYRVIGPAQEGTGGACQRSFHRPRYDGEREDFVDVEWEFVEAAPWDADLRAKLQRWATDEGRLLTVVMAHEDGNRNQSEALLLPDELFRNGVPVHVWGQEDCGYDVTLPLVRMAKNVNYVYDRCYAENFADDEGLHPSPFTPHPSPLLVPAEIDREAREHSWARLSGVKRLSNIYNAMTIASKMRSAGLEENEWDLFYDIPQQDIELLAQVEHNRWSVEELILGFRPCTDQEQQQVEADISQKSVLKKRMVHYDLRAYNDLRADDTGKSVKVYDRCICAALPLIAKAFAEEKGGGA